MSGARVRNWPGPADTGSDVLAMGRVNAARGGAPGRSRATAGRAAPGPDAGAGGAAPGPQRAVVRGGAPGVVFPDGPGAHAARLVWGVLTAAVDPLSASAIGLSATVAPQLVRAALEFFEQAGLVLRIPGEPDRRGKAQQLWVLAGGVREGLGVAADAERQRHTASGGYAHGPALLAGAQASGTPRAVDCDPAPGAVRRGADADTAQEAVDLEAVLPFPKELSGARPGHRRVWRVLIEAEKVLRTVEVAEAAGISRSATASALAALARVRAVRRLREEGSDHWVLPPASLAARDKALGVTRSAAPPPAAKNPASGSVPVANPASAPAPVPAPGGPFPAVSGRAAAAVGVVSGLRRLRKGELEAMVLTELRGRYPEELGPTGLSHLLGGYSSGAITNCLVRLVVKAQVECTCEAPKRYRAVPDAGPRSPRRRTAG